MAYIKVIIVMVLFGICLIPRIDAVSKPRMCVHYVDTQMDDSDESNQSDNDEYEYLTSSENQPPGHVECKEDYHYCFSLWSIESNVSKTIRQGCWQDNDGPNASCSLKECIGQPLKTENVYYCCCAGDLCNDNMDFYPIGRISSVVKSVITKVLNTSPAAANDETNVLTAIIPVVLIIISIGIAIVAAIVVCYAGDERGPEIAPLAPAGPGYSSNTHYVDNLKLCSMIGSGKYGTVWKGMINEQPVAVKIYPSNHKQYFINERNIYMLPFMDSPSLLEYFGNDERRTLDDRIEFLLVFSLAPLGCLQDWLAENTTDYGVFCKMAKSVTRGLSHLHTELKWGNEKKPCVCHRDLNTRNILVKADLSCCIADFGLALKVSGACYEYKGQIANTETKSLNEVGTVRYMAPEILEGAVNLRDCETALKQIDVYSLGLVLWELCTRCEDFYPFDQNVPPYMTPYEAEVGKNPTLHEMQLLVAYHKTRPTFPPGWGGGCSPAEIAKDTCEDCWDPDSEARLTSLCVEERIHELSYLRPLRYCSPSVYAGCSVIERKSNSLSSDSYTNLVPIQPYRNPQQMETSTLKDRFNDMQPTYQGHHIEPTTDSQQEILEHTENRVTRTESDISVMDCAPTELLKDEKLNMVQGYQNSNYPTQPLQRGWHTVRLLIQNKFFRNYDSYSLRFEDKSNLVDSSAKASTDAYSPIKDLTVNFINNKNNGTVETKVDTSFRRPDNLNLSSITIRVNGLSPENKPNLNNNISKLELNKQKIGSLNQNGKINAALNLKKQQMPRIVVSKSANAVNIGAKSSIEESTAGSVTYVDEKYITRQQSLEKFREIFSGKGSTEKLRDPSQRVKTPGDVPPSVRKVRASKTLSLYDDRMMDSSQLNIL